MKKRVGVFVLLLFFSGFSFGEEVFSLYAGMTPNKTTLVGLSLGGDILHFLQMQVDLFKYLKRDFSLHDADARVDRGDFAGLSLNFVLKLPIHLLPYLDEWDFFQPYILTGIGYGLENLNSKYFKVPTKDGKTGIFSKMRRFATFGVGFNIMVGPRLGIKIDARTFTISGHDGMRYSSRHITRFSLGLCFGSYKELSIVPGPDSAKSK